MSKKPRDIPRVLPIHMGMAASYWHRGFADGGMDAAGVHHDMVAMMRGMKLYLDHPYRRAVPALDCALAMEEAALLSVPGHDYAANAPVVLLVPSLINASDILDLKDDRSMLRWFCARGMHGYVLDWGSLTDDAGAQDIDALIMNKIVHAAAFLRERHGRKIHVLGYCMGGTMSVLACARQPDFFAGCVALAAPWDFDAGSMALTNRIRFWAPQLMVQLRSKGHMSVDWLQMLFASLDHSLTLRKFIRFAEMDQNAAEAALFVAVEDWLNDGVTLPVGVAQAVIQDWFFENKPMTMIEDFDVPLFVVASSKDRLVEYETAAALAGQVKNAALHDPVCGHIGMIAGAHAVADVWEPIRDWILEN